MQQSANALAGESETPVFRHSARHTKDMDHLISLYRGEPVETSFRGLVGVLPADELTHSLYPYPARLLRHIPRMLLSTKQVMSDIDYVIDPFCGSGTVLLEAQNRGIQSVGIDQNPVASLVSRVKTSPLEPSEMAFHLGATMKLAKRSRKTSLPAEYLRRWYDAPALSGLTRLVGAIDAVPDARYRDYLSLVLALSAKKLSHADPRIPVPVRNSSGVVRRVQSVQEVWDVWIATGERLATKVSRLRRAVRSAHVSNGDARNLQAWRSPHLGKSSLVITSPPYGAAQKYIRSTSLEAGWLGYASDKGTIDLERASVGREHLNALDRRLTPAPLRNAELERILAEIAADHPMRSSIYTNYFLDMQRVFNNCASDEVNCRRLVLICGTNIVRGEVIPTHEFLSQIASQFGFVRRVSMRDPIRGRTLLTRRRSGSAPAPAEYVEVFERA